MEMIQHFETSRTCARSVRKRTMKISYICLARLGFWLGWLKTPGGLKLYSVFFQGAPAEIMRHAWSDAQILCGRPVSWPTRNERAYSGKSAASVPDRVCICASRRLPGIPKVRFSGGRPDVAS
jgi:hypothetical protein